MFPGTTIKLGGEDYVLPAMSLRFMFDNEELIAQLSNPQGVSVLQYAKLSAPIVAGALRRNYPEMTDERYEEIADPVTSLDLVTIVLAQSGFAPLAVAAPAASAEAAPQAETKSSDSSSTQPDGSPTTSSTV